MPCAATAGPSSRRSRRTTAGCGARATSPRSSRGRSSRSDSRGNELERGAVVAVALARGLRAVVEHVPLVSLATRAVVFGARQDQLEVGLGLEASRDEREEARPARAALELRVGGEQREVAAGADERALAMLAVQRARARPLGRLAPQHRVLLRREALLPLLVGEPDLVDLAGILGARGGGSALRDEERAEGCDEISAGHVHEVMYANARESDAAPRPYAVPPTVRPSMRMVGWPTPTGMFWPSLPHMPMPGSRHMSSPIIV